MNDFSFKIFGAPYTFDLYQGTPNENGYFETFDNGGKEKVKLTVHRMASGRVSYSYLRYNMMTSGGRTNSFFGMSVVFDKEYCKDIEGLFNLFDHVYTDNIIKNNIIITELKGQSLQAKYLVKTFAEAEKEVQNIKNVIVSKIKNDFKQNIFAIDNLFTKSNSMLKIKRGASNDTIIAALRKHSWVHISPEYKSNEKPSPSPEFLNNLDETAQNISSSVVEIVNKISEKHENVKNELDGCLAKTTASITEISNWMASAYPQAQESLPDLLKKQPDLEKYYKKLISSQKALNNLTTPKESTPPEDSSRTVISLNINQNAQQTKTEEKELQNSGSTKETEKQKDTDIDKNPTPPIPFSQKYKKALVFAGGTVAVVSLLVLAIYFAPPEFTDSFQNLFTSAPAPAPVPPATSAEKWKVKGNEALGINDFDEAIKCYKKAEDTTLVSETKEKAVAYCYEQATKETDLREQLGWLEKAKSYGGNASTDNDIAEVERQIAQAVRPTPPAPQKPARVTTPPKPQSTGSGGSTSPISTDPTQSQPLGCEDVKIQITAGKKTIYRKGDKFTIVAKSGNNVCESGYWDYEPGLWADKYANPTLFEIKFVPVSGVATLRYIIGGRQQQAITVNINP